MKVLSLAWKYHPRLTSGVGVACEGLNNALSKLVDLTVIYPKVSNVKVKEEIVYGSQDLSEDQKKRIEEEYYKLVDERRIELAVKLDPYYISSQNILEEHPKEAARKKEDHPGFQKGKRKLGYKKITKKLLFDEVDVFGESVKDKIFIYNRLVEELAENISFDIIHAHDWMTFLAGIALKNRYHKPLVLHVHSLEYDRVGHRDASWVYDIERYAMSKADKVISVSQYTQGIIESNYGLSQNHIRKIYNAITFPDELVVKNYEKDDKVRILFSGRIDGNKGIEYFIKIASLILKALDNVEFLVVGRGIGKVDFDTLEGYHEIKPKFNYLGFVDRNKLFQLYATCDVLCMPSISEPFGLTAIEAAHVGLPVVLSTKTGASEIMKRTLMADFWDTEKFAKHVITIIRNKKVRQSIIANNKEDVEGLSWEKSAKKVKQVYKELVRL